MSSSISEIPASVFLDASKSARITYVSPLNGDDATGDGTLFNPYATIQKAIDNATTDAEVGGDAVWIYVDGPVPTAFNHPVDIPVGAFVSISAIPGANNPYVIIDLTLRSNIELYLDNIGVDSLTYIPTGGASLMFTENGYIEDTISGVAAELTVTAHGTTFASAAITAYTSASATVKGTVDSVVVSGDLGNLNGGWFNGKRIQAVADPVDAQDAVTKNYHDTAPRNPMIVTARTTGPYTALATDELITGDTTSAGFTINLPTAVGIAGKVYDIKKISSDGNALTVDPNGAQTIDGGATAIITAQWTNLTLISDGSNWLIL